MSVQAILGPLISTADLPALRDIFVRVFSMQVSAVQDLDRAACADLFGLPSHTAQWSWLHTTGVSAGVGLLRFDPLSDRIIRAGDAASARDHDALKVLDFYTPDVAAAAAHLRACGYQLKDEIAAYNLPEGRFTEAHFWAPEGVVCALLGGPDDFFSGFATITDQRVSEVQSMSGPVTDHKPVLQWYEAVLGLTPVYEYGVQDGSFDALVDSAETLQLKAINVGLDRKQPYFGLIHYGLPAGSTRSLRDHAIWPNRGILGALLLMDDITGPVARCVAAGGEVLVPPAEMELAPWGRVESASLRAPHGVIHMLIRPV